MMIRMLPIALVLTTLADHVNGWGFKTPVTRRDAVVSTIAASGLLLPRAAFGVAEETDRIVTRMGGLLVRVVIFLLTR